MTLYTKDRSLKLSMEEIHLESLIKFITTAGKKETGGIIIGRYSLGHQEAIITELTDKPKDSLSGFFSFLRGKSGLKKLLEKKWENNEYYLGEWHFHPEAPPNPSPQDYRTMRKIMLEKKYKCPEPIMMIIGGIPHDYLIRSFLFIGNEILEFEV